MAAKAVSSVIRRLKYGSATTLPGKIAQKIDTNVLSNLSKQIATATFLVTGTNGKTTVSGLLTQFLNESQHRVVHNHLGANMLPGITAAMVNQSSLLAKLAADFAVLEVDEASMGAVSLQVNAQVIVVNNLFRDQLDRYGELETTRQLIQRGVTVCAGTNTVTLILNADDPLVSEMHLNNQNVQCLFFGIETVTYQNLSSSMPNVPYSQETISCPLCGANLRVDYQTFAHLGHYRCTACHYQRPKPTVFAQSVILHPEYSDVLVNANPHINQWIKLPLPGLFNVYNFLAALAAALTQQVSWPSIQQGVENYKSVFGRAEKRTINGKKLLVMLIKNPIGASEVLKLVASDPNARIIIALNDDYADGRDVSWIWDAQFDLLTKQVTQNTKPIFVSGKRAHDMTTCLKYAGIKPEELITIVNLDDALNKAISATQTCETLYVLPTYTALLHLKNTWNKSPRTAA
ncbi:MAG: MurT ligase domain-containing protein [Cyanobacteria bacterium P01_H01_bin.74]